MYEGFSSLYLTFSHYFLLLLLSIKLLCPSPANDLLSLVAAVVASKDADCETGCNRDIMAPGTNKAAHPLRDKLDDDTLDLSLMQLSDVPVNYIVSPN
jgi:hypothetical protein